MNLTKGLKQIFWCLCVTFSQQMLITLYLQKKKLPKVAINIKWMVNSIWNHAKCNTPKNVDLIKLKYSLLFLICFNLRTQIVSMFLYYLTGVPCYTKACIPLNSLYYQNYWNSTLFIDQILNSTKPKKKKKTTNRTAQLEWKNTSTSLPW